MAKVRMIVLHWTAGRYQPNATDLRDYHGVVKYDLKADRASWVKLGAYSETRQHVWQENTGSVGLAVCGMYRATPLDFGPCPLKPAQVDLLVQVAAEICFLKSLPAQRVWTHAERAVIKGYGVGSGDPETRWDLAVLAPVSTPITETQVFATGSGLRRRIHTILEDLHYKRTALQYHEAP